MRNLQELLDRFSFARLKKLRTLLPKARNKYDDVLALAASKREKIEPLLPPDFSWASLYELEFKEMLILNLSVLGMLEMLTRAYRAGLDLNQYLMDLTIHEAENIDSEDTRAGGHGGIYTEADLIKTTHAYQNSWRCMSIYGHFLNDLVKQVRDGGKYADEAFFKAITIDRTILTCPTFAARLARAEYFGEKDFLRHLRKAFKGKPHDALLVHQDLRSWMHVFSDMNILDKLSVNEADFLFIQELKLYQDAGEDPARSLMRFIQRWKEQKSLAT